MTYRLSSVSHIYNVKAPLRVPFHDPMIRHNPGCLMPVETIQSKSQKGQIERSKPIHSKIG